MWHRHSFADAANDLALAWHYVQLLSQVFPGEKYLLLPCEDRKAIERAWRVERINAFLIKGENTLTIDLGCRAGQTTIPLQLATRGKVIGVDCNKNSIRLARARTANNPSVDYLVQDFVRWDVPRNIVGRADQIFASHFLHEIFSAYGRPGYCQALIKCQALLRQGGRLIILDGVHPECVSATIRFRDRQTDAQFERFIDLFKMFRIVYESLDEWTIGIDLGDFARFLNCLKFIVPVDLKGYEATLPGIENEKERTARAYYILDYYTRHPRDYVSEYEQDFTFNSRVQWLDTLNAVGFHVEHLALYNERPIETCFWKSGIEILSPDTKIPGIYICIVGRKK